MEVGGRKERDVSKGSEEKLDLLTYVDVHPVISHGGTMGWYTILTDPVEPTWIPLNRFFIDPST